MKGWLSLTPASPSEITLASAISPGLGVVCQKNKERKGQVLQSQLKTWNFCTSQPDPSLLLWHPLSESALGTAQTSQHLQRREYEPKSTSFYERKKLMTVLPLRSVYWPTVFLQWRCHPGKGKIFEMVVPFKFLLDMIFLRKTNLSGYYWITTNAHHFYTRHLQTKSTCVAITRRWEHEIEWIEVDFLQ